MPHHLQLVSDAKRAIDRVFGDSSVDRCTTRASLQEIRDEIDVKLDSLDSDDDASVAEDE